MGKLSFLSLPPGRAGRAGRVGGSVRRTRGLFVARAREPKASRTQELKDIEGFKDPRSAGQRIVGQRHERPQKL